MRIFGMMVCCKDMREKHGLACEPGWMVGCLANHCARLPTPVDRRRFMSEVVSVRKISNAGLQSVFEAEVERLVQAGKTKK